MQSKHSEIRPTSTFEDHSSGPRREIGYALLALAIFMAANWVYRGERLPYDPALDTRWRDQIETQRPDSVFVGNSMLGQNFKEDLFTELTGNEIAKMYVPGSASAIWYLLVKHQVAEAQYKPKNLVIFFRDTRLTDPQFRTTGADMVFMDTFATADDSLLLKYTYRDRAYKGGILGVFFQTIHSNRERLKKNVIDAVQYGPIEKLWGTPPRRTKRYINEVFAWHHMNFAILNDAQLEEEFETAEVAFDFDQRLNTSYLPVILDICEEHNISVSFVRLKKRAIARGSKESLPLTEYIADLRAYVESRGATFYDYGGHPAITVDMYDVGDHLRPEGARTFTRLLAEDMGPRLDQQP